MLNGRYDCGTLLHPNHTCHSCADYTVHNTRYCGINTQMMRLCSVGMQGWRFRCETINFSALLKAFGLYPVTCCISFELMIVRHLQQRL
ncbi:uncharacterized protein BJX67DRAFT_342246 [Aspergillus lucknowensis]|uniref:Uncharacterized protein n=1 Tax=Aspergillus lucknowensis TaxID=176173 RepID=A0ABR4M4B7_9EURO